MNDHSAQVGCLLFQIDESGGGEAWTHGRLPLSGPAAKTFPPSLVSPTLRILCIALSHWSPRADPAHDEGISIMLLEKASSTIGQISLTQRDQLLFRLSHTYRIWVKTVRHHGRGNWGRVGEATRVSSALDHPFVDAAKAYNRLVSKVYRKSLVACPRSTAGLSLVSWRGSRQEKAKSEIGGKHLSWFIHHSRPHLSVCSASDSQKHRPVTFWKHASMYVFLTSVTSCSATPCRQLEAAAQLITCLLIITSALSLFPSFVTLSCFSTLRRRFSTVHFLFQHGRVDGSAG